MRKFIVKVTTTKEFEIELDNKTGTFTDEERHGVTAKIIIMDDLLENIFKE